MEKAETKTYIEQQMRLAGAAEPLFVRVRPTAFLTC
jgi:hypothetical protein